MALSLDSIYKPVNDFFLDLFKTDTDSPVFFRFDKFGSVISNEDFIDPRTPELGYSAPLARERFSGIVNNIAVEDPDSIDVFFTENNIDDAYHDLLLGPSLPFFPEDADELTRESIITSFSFIKSEATRVWDNIQLESSSGLMFKFKPALATPVNWYDTADDSIWTSHQFEASETVTPVENSSNQQLWRLKIDDTIFQQVLPAETIQLKDSDSILNQVLLKKANTAVPITNFSSVATSVVKKDSGIAGARTLARTNVGFAIKNTAVIETVKEVQNLPTFNLHNTFRNTISGMDPKKRLVVSQFVKSIAPTQPVTTSSITVSFEYCLVKINRPWIHSSFLNNKAWYIPDTEKGQLSKTDSFGVNITALPIGFLAIKNLNIAANWTDEDITNSKKATDFGPFEVSFDSITNKLSHPGIQIIGWMFQKMPDLPPNNAHF